VKFSPQRSKNTIISKQSLLRKTFSLSKLKVED